MVKRNPPVSPPTSEVEEDFSNLHPLNRGHSKVQDLIDGAKKRAEAKEFRIEELDEWKKCVNGVASTPNGKLFIKSMLQFAGLFEDRAQPQQMILDKIRASFYLRWVRPFLQQDLRKEIEP